MLVPPGNKGLIISSLMSDFPIQLRNAVVYPTIIHPQKYIGIKVIKILQTIRFRTIRIISFIAINTERRNTKFYPRFYMMYSLPQLLYKSAYVISSPISNIPIAMRVLLIQGLVWNLFACYWIRIEIIIYMETIYIISADDVGCHFADVISRFLQTRIEKH